MIDTLRIFYRTVKTLLFGATTEPAGTTTVSAPASVQSLESTSIPVLEADRLAPIVESLNIEPESPAPEILVGPAAETASVDEWSVHPYVNPVFVKVGRGYLDSGDLIIRSDQDSRGFILPEDDIDKALTGGSGTVRLLDLTATVGTAHLSTSGLVLNIVIDQQLHTVPLFVPKDDVAPD
jgi:hypothetical protein